MARAVTLIELCIVVAIVGLGITAAMASMSAITRAARVNQQLAIVNLEVREARARALEQRAAYFVEPTAAGIVVRTGTCADPDTCVAVGVGRAVALPDLAASGDVLAFNTDGRPPGSVTKTLGLGGAMQLELGGAGTLRWLGAGGLDAQIDGKQEIRLSAQEVAKQ